jgi:uncharacterized protein DUF2800
MEEGLPDEDSEMSREGQLLHDYAAHPEYDRRMLKPNQKDLVDSSDDLAAIVISQIEKDHCRGFHYKDYVEQAMSFQGDKWPGIVVHGSEFGTPDLVRYWSTDYKETDCKAALVIDRKFGFKVVERAELNLQLLVYAVLATDFVITQPEKVFVSIIQPRAPFEERITVAQYLPEDIDAARDRIMQILKESSRNRAKLVAGDEQCEYCRAKLTCPAFRDAMRVPDQLVPSAALSKAAKLAYLEQRLAECSDTELEKVILAVRLAATVKDLAYDEARKRIDAGTMKNFTKAKDAEVREIVHVRKAMSLLSLAGIDASDRYDCVTHFSVTQLTDKLRKRHPNWTVKQANDWINTKLKSCIELQTRRGKLIKR